MWISSGSSIPKYTISRQSRGPRENSAINLKVQAQDMNNSQPQPLISRSTGPIAINKKSIIPSRNEGNSMKQEMQVKNKSRNLTQPKNFNELQMKNPSSLWSRLTMRSQNKPETQNTISSDIRRNKIDNKNQKSSLNFQSISAEQILISPQQKFTAQLSITNQTGEARLIQKQNKTSVAYNQDQMGMQMPNDQDTSLLIVQNKHKSVSQLEQKIAASIITNSQLNSPFSSQFLQQLSSFIDSEYPSSSLKNSQLLTSDRNKLKAQPCKYCAKQEFNLSLKTMCQQCFTKFLLGYQLQQINTKKEEPIKEKTEIIPKVAGHFQRFVGSTFWFMI